MALLLPHAGLHDAYVGLRSSNPVVRGNAIEFLDNVLKPELRQLLVPLLDSSVPVAERIALANGLVGAPLETAEQAVTTLLASEDSWLRSCAVYAIGAMQLEGLEARARSVREGAGSDDAADRAAGAAAAGRAGGYRDAPQEPVPPRWASASAQAKTDSRVRVPDPESRAVTTDRAAAPALDCACARWRGSSARAVAPAPARRLQAPSGGSVRDRCRALAASASSTRIARRRLLQDRGRDAEVRRERANVARQQSAEREQVDPCIAVLDDRSRPSRRSGSPIPRPHTPAPPPPHRRWSCAPARSRRPPNRDRGGPLRRARAAGAARRVLRPRRPGDCRSGAPLMARDRSAAPGCRSDPRPAARPARRRIVVAGQDAARAWPPAAS